MKKSLILLLSSTVVATVYSQNIITLADSVNHTPVVNASVISSNGVIMGASDSNGHIELAPSDFPISIRCLGYNAVTIAGAQNDTVYISPTTYRLPDVTVTPVDRPVTRVLTYAREYSTSASASDTIQMYCEYMIEYFFADGKVKGFKKSHSNGHGVASNCYARISGADGRDSIMRPRYDDDIVAMSFITYMASVPNEPVRLTDRMAAGSPTDTVNGKYFPKYVHRTNDRFLTIDKDALADHKGHAWSPWILKLLGLTMEIQEANCSLIYNLNDTGIYTLNDYIMSSCSLRVLGKGRLFKKMMGLKDAVDIYSYIEQYPVDIEHITADDYKEMKETYDERREVMRAPENVTPLPPAVQSLVERIERELPKE